MKCEWEEYINRLDIAYSYSLAKKMEKKRTNPVLGYRSAGSKAELLTGDLLAEEMKAIGLSKVWKDPIKIDSWEFHKAILCYQDSNGNQKQIQMGAYQTQFVTDGFEPFELIYIGKGVKDDYKNIDVTGKLVLVDINQRDEWWINYPVYQAYLKGARALIAVQTGGYGEVDDVALNAQDIAGPAEAAAFSISRKDAEEIKSLLNEKKIIEVFLDADSQIKRNSTSYNIIGEIEGKNTERKIMLSAHYDSYFDGFQDDNTAISMMLGMTKALLEIGYKPQNTILICAMAAEEWGVVDSAFDWSSGAYEQVFTLHPEWRGQVIADMNFELPALAHGTRARIRSTYEYVDFLEDFLEELPDLTQAYPEDTRITAPIETWSDDFSIAIAGIPSMVNDFTGGSFLATHYHSQFDNDNYYDKDVYRMHHELFGLLLMQIDNTSIVPLNFQTVLEKAADAFDEDICEMAKVDGEKLKTLMMETSGIARNVYEEVSRYNELRIKDKHTAKIEKVLLRLFQMEQDTFVKIDWYGNVVLPHVVIQESLELLAGAKDNLLENNLSAAMKKIYEIDNNKYAFLFDEEVYTHFTSYVYNQPKERLKWGYQRIIGYVDLYGIVKSLLEKRDCNDDNYQGEIDFLSIAVEKQIKVYRSLCDELKNNVEEMKQMLLTCLQK